MKVWESVGGCGDHPEGGGGVPGMKVWESTRYEGVGEEHQV